MRTWQIQQAKARMSELIERAQSQPQDITRRGKSVAVVMSREAFDRLSQTQDSLVDFMRRSPCMTTSRLSAIAAQPGMCRFELFDWHQSELRCKLPDHRVVRWFAQRPPVSLYLNVLTLGDIRNGIRGVSDAWGLLFSLHRHGQFDSSRFKNLCRYIRNESKAADSFCEPRFGTFVK